MIGAPNFKETEFYCPCGECEITLPTLQLIRTLQAIRTDFAKPMTIKSGIRCEKHNEAIGGAKKSRHVPRYGGDAVDVACSDASDRYRLVGLAIRHGVKCIEISPLHLHFDMRAGPYMLIMGPDK